MRFFSSCYCALNYMYKKYCSRKFNRWKKLFEKFFFCINSFNHNKLIFYGCIMWEIWEFSWNLWHRMMRLLKRSEVIELIGLLTLKSWNQRVIFWPEILCSSISSRSIHFGSVTLVRIIFVQFLSNSRIIPHTHIRKSYIIFNVYASHTKSAE